jgi:hypothetical protein
VLQTVQSKRKGGTNLDRYQTKTGQILFDLVLN